MDQMSPRHVQSIKKAGQTLNTDTPPPGGGVGWSELTRVPLRRILRYPSGRDKGPLDNLHKKPSPFVKCETEVERGGRDSSAVKNV